MFLLKPFHSNCNCHNPKCLRLNLKPVKIEFQSYVLKLWELIRGPQASFRSMILLSWMQWHSYWANGGRKKGCGRKRPWSMKIRALHFHLGNIKKKKLGNIPQDFFWRLRLPAKSILQWLRVTALELALPINLISSAVRFLIPAFAASKVFATSRDSSWKIPSKGFRSQLAGLSYKNLQLSSLLYVYEIFSSKQ